jgi:hypothetical protein
MHTYTTIANLMRQTLPSIIKNMYVPASLEALRELAICTSLMLSKL